MNWREFEAAAPDLAEQGRQRLQRTNVALLATLRADGSPRISPIGPSLAGGQLLFGAMHSSKVADLRRDARCAVHSSVSDINGSEGEFQLLGRAVEVTDAELRAADPEAWWLAHPSDASFVYSLDIESASLVTWNLESSELEITRWSVRHGVSVSRRTYP